MSKPPAVIYYLRLHKVLSCSWSWGHFDMHPSAPPSPESMNEMHLANEMTAEAVSADEVAIIFSFLLPKEIMRARVCKTWRDAARKTLVPVPPSKFRFRVGGVKSYNAMRVMSSALPHLQQLSISNINGRHKYIDGEDPDERRARYTANYTTHDINIISSFRKLRSLEIGGAHLSGRYPVLSTFPLLTKMSISDCIYLKFDLEMLVGIPQLKELQLLGNQQLTGNLESLRALRGTLEKVVIHDSRIIEGNFMVLADFPRLKELDLTLTSVAGDIRDIRRNNFPALERLLLPKSVRGGVNYRFQHISDVPSFMNAIHLLLQRTPPLLENGWLSSAFGWRLSEDSPEWYCYGFEVPESPFLLRLIRAGSRRGWSWCTFDDDDDEEEDDDEDEDDERHSCEINWLDPEPSRNSSDFVAYTEEMQRVERNIDFYRGYYNPPTRNEYIRLCEE